MSMLVTFTVASDLAVVGYNPEAADLDCPNGEIVREMFFLVAEAPRGDRWAWGWFSSASEAEAAIPTAPPVFGGEWGARRPCYGSAAYVAYGEADDIESEGRQAEDEAWGFDTRFTRY